MSFGRKGDPLGTDKKPHLNELSKLSLEYLDTQGLSSAVDELFEGAVEAGFSPSDVDRLRDEVEKVAAALVYDVHELALRYIVVGITAAIMAPIHETANGHLKDMAEYMTMSNEGLVAMMKRWRDEAAESR